MILNEEQRTEFEKVSRPLMKFLADNFSPYAVATVEITKAEIAEKSFIFPTEDYIQD